VDAAEEADRRHVEARIAERHDVDREPVADASDDAMLDPRPALLHHLAELFEFPRVLIRSRQDRAGASATK
jgi:hypothetical protein